MTFTFVSSPIAQTIATGRERGYKPVRIPRLEARSWPTYSRTAHCWCELRFIALVNTVASFCEI